MKFLSGLLLAVAVGVSTTGCASLAKLGSGSASTAVQPKTVAAKPTKVAVKTTTTTPQSSASAHASKLASGKSNMHSLVGKHARAAGVPVALALAVVQVESSFNPRARGQAGEVGLMQIKPATARGIGYKGSIKALYNPSTNLTWGMKYLAEAQRRGDGTVCGTILKYNAGHYAKRMTKISLHYCGKVKLIMQKTA